MTWDMKLGLLVGIGVVLAVALVYYKPEGGLNLKPKESKNQIQNHRTVQLAPMPK